MHGYDLRARDRAVAPPMLRLPEELLVEMMSILPVKDALRLKVSCKALNSSPAFSNCKDLYEQERRGLRELELLPAGGLVYIGRIFKALGAQLQGRQKDIDDWMLASREFREKRFFLNVDHMESEKKAAMKLKLLANPAVIQAWQRAPKLK